MIWQIYADNNLIYETGLNINCLSPNLELEVNTAGAFTFTLPYNHFYANNIILLKTIIKVVKDNEVLFIGRVINEATNWNNSKTYDCEGCLSFFNDSVIRPYDFQSGDLSTTPHDLLMYFINLHNSQVDESKRFTIGNVTLTGNIIRANESYESTLTNIKNKLIDPLGGYLLPRYENGVIYLDYLEEITAYSDQTIKVSKNLLDLTKNLPGDEIATILIPLGAKDEETGQYLTIAEVNDGNDFIEDTDAITQYGRVVAVKQWDDVTIAANLLTKATAYLNNLTQQQLTINASLLDLSAVESVGSLKVGTYVVIKDDLHDVNRTMLINKISYDLTNPANNNITLSKAYNGRERVIPSLSGQLVTTAQSAANSVIMAENTAQTISGIAAGQREIVATVAEIQNEVAFGTLIDVTNAGFDIYGVEAIVEGEPVASSAFTRITKDGMEIYSNAQTKVAEAKNSLFKVNTFQTGNWRLESSVNGDWDVLTFYCRKEA